MYRLKRAFVISIIVLVIASALRIALDQNSLSPILIAAFLLLLVPNIEGLNILWGWSSPPEKRVSQPLPLEMYLKGVLNRHNDTKLQVELVGNLETKLLEEHKGENNLSKFRKLTQNHKPFVLVGSTGAGKTTLLEDVLVRSAKGYKELADYIPFEINLGDINKNQNFQEVLNYWWRDHYNIEGDLDTFLNNQLILLVVDGLNELPGNTSDQRRFVQSMRLFLKKHPKIPIIVSYWDNDENYISDLGLPIVRVKPLETAQIRQYIENVEGDSKFWNELETNKSTLELVRNPHSLLLLTDYYKITQKLPEDPERLYEVVVQQRYKKYAKNQLFREPLRLILLAVEHFAFTGALHGERSIDMANAGRFFSHSQLNAAIELQILKKVDNSVFFTHPNFYDYFALNELVRRLKSRRQLGLSFALFIIAILFLIFSFIPLGNISGISPTIADFNTRYSALISFNFLLISRIFWQFGSIEALIKQRRVAVSEADLQVVRLLSEAAKNSDALVRNRATALLGETQSSSAIPALALRLKDDDALIRNTATKALSKIVSPAVVPLINSALEDPSPVIRHNAAVALLQIGDKTSIPALQKAIQDTDQRVREQAQRSLDQINDLHDRKWKVRKMTIEVAGRQGPRAIPQLISALEDYEEEVQYAAARALSRLAPTSIPPLIDQLDNSERQYAAASALIWMGKKALPALESALEDSRFKRTFIEEIIEEINKE